MTEKLNNLRLELELSETMKLQTDDLWLKSNLVEMIGLLMKKSTI